MSDKTAEMAANRLLERWCRLKIPDISYARSAKRQHVFLQIKALKAKIALLQFEAKHKVGGEDV
jgi:hypothetical protein